MNKIVQCVPNISEGRDLDKIEKIVQPLKNNKGFKLVSYEPDQDYNRTVITLIGNPDDMIDPLVAFFKEALNHIDMNHHKGEHPRMGAVDVVPFIPIEGVSIDECVSYAKNLAEKVNTSLDIPIYLYAQAASTSDRENLPTIRKGEFEGMKEKIKDPTWNPDYGKPQIHETFGVTAIGARIPLIAYNIDLDTDDLDIAKTLAKTIRKSSGGFQYIQAGPAYLEEKGHTQVTMNILDYKKNPIYRMYEMIHMEALRYNVKVMSSEIVGLVPKDAIYRSLIYYLDMHHIAYDKHMSLNQMTSYAIKYLGFRDFDSSKIIEYHIEDLS
ncbi:glutamate formimidoyltransferase [Tenericutes bacterium MO-XQ]|nr:glutamate formimidoyltransferase [Tenericutes bacterium MO-XQ]